MSFSAHNGIGRIQSGNQVIGIGHGGSEDATATFFVFILGLTTALGWQNANEISGCITIVLELIP